MSFTSIQQQTYSRKQLTDHKDDNSLAALPTERAQIRFCEVVNTCTERRAKKRIQRTAWILRHVLRQTLCEHVNGLCPAGWLNEQSITKHWFQSVRTCAYGWATGRKRFMWAACKELALKFEKKKKYNGSVACRPLFYYLNGRIAEQRGYDKVVEPYFNQKLWATK